MNHECPAQSTSFMNVKSWPPAGFRHILRWLSACEWSALEVNLVHSDHVRDEEDSKMPRVKASKQKRVTKAVPALGAAGLTFSLVGGASAAVAPANDESQTSNYSPNHQITLGEEEIADVSLATFYVFDKESADAARNGVQVAWRGCGGCRGCGCRGCR